MAPPGCAERRLCVSPRTHTEHPRPRRTRNPENTPPHRWRACHAGPYKQKASPRKNTPALSYYIVGASIARPPLPNPQPLNTPPHRWRACNAGPYKRKGSPTQKHPQPFLLYSRGGAWLRPGSPNAGSCVSPSTQHRTPPPLPHPQPRKSTPVPLAGLPCRPLQAKGKIFVKIYRSFVILS